MAGFETTLAPLHGVDAAETTGHAERWREDLDGVLGAGVRHLRYPVRWHRVEPEPGRYDWDGTDRVMAHLRERGAVPVVDLLHHTSYPLWLGDFSAPSFEDRFLRFVEAVADRYPWLPGYTVCNEPFTTFLLCGQEGVWPPHWRGLDGFLRLARNVFPAVTSASRALHDLLPDADHVHVEASERHTWSTAEGEEFARMTNDRRFLLTDLLVGRSIDPHRPFVEDLLRAGGEDLLTVEAGHVDVLGLDYYAHNQWEWSGVGQGTTMAPAPASLCDLITEYWARYAIPCLLGETNIRGYASDRATWLKWTLEQCELARAGGVDLRGYCWFPFIDSADWDSLLFRCEGNVDPVGVHWLDDRLDRRSSTMSDSYALAAAGAPAAELPAFSFQEPVATWLRGYLPQMAHWDWRPPPADEVCSQTASPDERIELRISDGT